MAAGSTAPASTVTSERALALNQNTVPPEG